MSQEQAFAHLQHCLWLVVQLLTPAIVATLGVGTAVSIFQAATQIQEQSLSFVPKILALLGALSVAGGWMILQSVDYGRAIFNALPGAAHGWN